VEQRPADIFRDFLDRAAGRRLVIACAADAAGLAAAEMARRWLAARAGPTPEIICPERCRLLIGPALADRACQARAEALLALDLGADESAALLDGPTLFLDQHRHGPCATARVIDSGPEPRPAGLVLYEILRELDPALAADLAWLAALAAEAAHPRLALPPDATTARHVSKTAVREAAVLLNAAGRAADYPVPAALAALASADGPAALVAGDSAANAILQEARTEVLREFGHWSHQRPHFMWRVALVPVASPCRIEAILAAMWERQLPAYMIVAANSGCAAGRITVVARTASAERNLLRLLDAVAPVGSPVQALGRRDYIEAIIPVAVWREMLAKMRFRDPSKLVPPPEGARLF
jgi:hypothetical protein